MGAPDLWPAQREAVDFCLQRPAAMLDMEMGTGKTRTAIEVIKARDGVRRVLVVCPKAVIPVWRREIGKYSSCGEFEVTERFPSDTVAKTAGKFEAVLSTTGESVRVMVVNYDSVWRRPLGDVLYGAAKDGLIDMVVLDESHRAKAAGSKVSKYLAMVGKAVPYRLCLSGTPMANSPLDVYGQYRFLDRSIFGTNHRAFLDRYAVMGGPERRFVVGLQNQQELMDRFRSIAYTCRMEDIRDRIKLPGSLPPVQVPVHLPPRDMRTLRGLARDFMAECGDGVVVAGNVLVRMLRMQQVCSGFCEVEDGPLGGSHVEETNTAKRDALASILEDLDPRSRLVVFCVFRHDLDAVREVADAAGRPYFELSGREHRVDEWRASEGGIVAVQIQAGAEGVDMTCASHAVYYSLPHSLALYDQSRARLYRPGQTRPVSFMHLVAEGTVDEAMYGSLMRKRDVIDSIRDGSFDFGVLK